MNGISFKQSLIQNIDNKTPAPTVDEIMAQPPVSTNPQEKKNSNLAGKIVTSAVVLAALGFAGRQGYLSKRVQKLLGGTPKLSKAQIEEKINAKLNDYIARTENTIFDIQPLGTNKYRATRIKANGNKEVITFNAKSGLPDCRVEFAKQKGDKSLEYTSYMGADILDADFDDAANFYKKFSRTGIKRKHGFGTKYTNTMIKYGEMVNPEGLQPLQKRTDYYNNNQISRIYEKDAFSNNEIVKEFLYGVNNKPKGIDLITSDGAVIRKLNGEAPVEVNAPNRKKFLGRRFLEFFSIQKKNIL